MATSEIYRRQVALLVETLPFIAEEPTLALKGGTAINLFVRNLPRLSVDIDLTYLPVEARPSSLLGIDAAIKRIAERVQKGIPGAFIVHGELRSEGVVNKLLVRANGVQIKIEVTPVMRGCVYDPVRMQVSPTVEETYGYVEAQVVSFHDLFAGKMTAALDRQHPRDLFDIRALFENEGLTDTLRTAFVVYLISHSRPAVEILAPHRHDIEVEFHGRFIGMTETPVKLEDLLEARETLIDQAVTQMPQSHRQFLIEFERGDHDWNALDVVGIGALPAVRWKIHNLAKLKREQRITQSNSLARVWDMV